jgi:hypothetical protein
MRFKKQLFSLLILVILVWCTGCNKISPSFEITPTVIRAEIHHSTITLPATWTPTPTFTPIPPTPTPAEIEALALLEGGHPRNWKLSFFSPGNNTPVSPVNMPVVNSRTFSVYNLVSSPDGRQLAFLSLGRNYYSLNLSTGKMISSPSLPDNNLDSWKDYEWSIEYPTWSPDGQVLMLPATYSHVDSNKPASNPFDHVIGMIFRWKIGDASLSQATDAVSMTLALNESVSDKAPALSPNGRWLAFIRVINMCIHELCERTNGTVVVMDLQNGTTRLLAQDQAFLYSRGNTLTWSPDSRWIAFLAGKDYPRIGVIYMENGEVRYPAGDLFGLSPVWSPDGQQIAFAVSMVEPEQYNYDGKLGNIGPTDILRVNLDGTNLVNLTNNPGNRGGPIWSLSGQWIAYTEESRQGWIVKVMDSNGKVLDFPENIVLQGGPVWVWLKNK